MIGWPHLVKALPTWPGIAKPATWNNIKRKILRNSEVLSFLLKEMLRHDRITAYTEIELINTDI